MFSPSSRVRTVIRSSFSQASRALLTRFRTTRSIILGASKIKHLEDNLGCLGWSLGEEDMAALDAISETDNPYPYDFLEMARTV